MNELALLKAGDKQITPAGDLYIEPVQGTLHRVQKYVCELIDGSEMRFSYKEYQLLLQAMEDASARFIRLQDGTIVAVNQIRKCTPKTMVIDSSKGGF